MHRVRTVFSGATGSPWLSTFYFDESGGLTAANAVADTGTFWSALDNFMKTSITWATDATVDQIDLAGNLTGSTGTTPQTGSGSSAADLLPLAVQGLIRWETGLILAGRRWRGHTFIPGLSEDSCDTSGQLASSVRTSIATACSNLIAAPNSALLAWSKVHASSTTLVSGAGQAKFAILRSRRD